MQSLHTTQFSIKRMLINLMGMILLKATFEKYTTFAHTFVVVRDVVLTTRAELFHSPSLTRMHTLTY